MNISRRNIIAKFEVGEIVYWKGDEAQIYPMTVSSIDGIGIDVTCFLGECFQRENFDEKELDKAK